MLWIKIFLGVAAAIFLTPVSLGLFFPRDRRLPLEPKKKPRRKELPPAGYYLG